MNYRLLDAFCATFERTQYKHRDSTLGDLIAQHLFEDLYELRKSVRLNRRIEHAHSVLNTKNTRRGVAARRGDGTFGEIVPNTPEFSVENFHVKRGQTANVEIGVEVKILAKAMIKQIGRVINDMRDQASQFRKGGGQPICVGIVGINQASIYTSYEKERAWTTDGTGLYRHPAQEAADAESRMDREVRSHFDEFLILRFRATNVNPFPFEWVNRQETEQDYSASLLRIIRVYDSRFGTTNGTDQNPR